MARLICPICRTATAFSAIRIEGIGVLVERSTEDNVVFGKVRIGAITSYESGQPRYAVLRCQACLNHFIARLDPGHEWSPVYPISHKAVSQDIPEDIRSMFEEAYLCFAVEAYRGCLLMCRTALIALQRQQNVSSLKELQDKGTISPILYGQSDEVRLWANMVGHEDVPDVIAREESEELLTYLEAILEAVYVQPKKLSRLTQKREQLKKGVKPSSSS